jgi:hypothetical protein
VRKSYGVFRMMCRILTMRKCFLRNR